MLVWEESMRVLKWLAIGLVGLVALVVVVGLFLPSGWSVEREVTVSNRPEAIRPYLDAPRQWPVWSAWNTTTYPDMTSSYEGPERGPGAAWVWKGESSGNGRLEITRSDAGVVAYRLQFEDFAPIDGAMYLETAGESTRVRWTMSGDMGGNPLSKYFALFMEGMMSSELETGLAKLKGLAEAAPRPEAAKAEAAAE
jgi:hypothetical protein